MAQWPCGRVSALALGGWEFDSQPSYTKDFKKWDPIPPLLGTQHKGLVLGGVCSGAPESTLYGLWCPVGVVGSIPEPVDLCRMSPPPSLSPFPVSLQLLSYLIKAKAPKISLKEKTWICLISHIPS